MKKIIVTIVMFAIAIALVIGVIIPLANRGKTSGEKLNSSITNTESKIEVLASPIP